MRSSGELSVCWPTADECWWASLQFPHITIILGSSELPLNTSIMFVCQTLYRRKFPDWDMQGGSKLQQLGMRRVQLKIWSRRVPLSSSLCGSVTHNLSLVVPKPPISCSWTPISTPERGAIQPVLQLSSEPR